MNTGAERAVGTRVAAPNECIETGRNCWRVATSTRTKIVHDAADYFRLAREAILAAEHSVFLLGWDLLANLDLLPGATNEHEPTRLAELLDHVVRRRRRLRCHVLVWDHSALYALERDPFTRLKLWMLHRRVHFRFDDRVPFGGSHHEKILVVDDRIAFSGSIDLTTHRWDTSSHRVDEPLRKNARGVAYGPYHDVQMMVEGPAAAALGELARERWRAMGKRRLPRPTPHGPSRWPRDTASDLPEIAVAISRTKPAFQGRRAVRENEALWLDAIAAARRWIYVENQYFTDARVGDALAARLREPEGPELVIVVPDQCSGWLERNTMGVLRGEVTVKLREADRHGRLRLVFPVASRAAGVATFVHSKITIVDDELLRVGSANLAARSMGMDTECDLTAIAKDAATRRAIARALDGFLAEHLGATVDDVREHRERAGGSLLAVLDALSGGDRTLVPLPEVPAPPPEIGAEPTATMRSIVDPNEPMALVADLKHALPELEEGANHGRRVARLLPIAVLALAVLAIWRSETWGLARLWADLDPILLAAPTSLATCIAVVGAFVIAGLAFLPTNVLTLLAAMLLGGWRGALCAFVGSCIAAVIGYRVGRHIGPRGLASWIGHRVYRLLRLLRTEDGWSVARLRVVPIASLTTIDLLCGAAAVRPSAYGVGTVLGLLPKIVSIALAGGILRHAFVHRSIGWATIGVAVVAALVLTMLWLRRFLLQQHVDRALLEHGERSQFG